MLYTLNTSNFYLDYILIKLGGGGNHLHIIKAIYEMPIANIILSGEKCQVFLLRSGAWQGCQLWPLLFSIVLAVPARTIMHKKKKASELERKQ